MPSDKIRAEHSPEAIRKRLSEDPSQNYLRDFIYGAIDGAVTTFAVVASVAATGLSTGVVIIMGLANLLADGFSMAAGNFLGTRAEIQTRDKRRRAEEKEIDSHPEGEREEIRQIFAAKGFEGEVLDQVVDVITSDKKRWVDTMITEEFGLPLNNPSAWKAAGVTYLAFVVVGFIPLITYILEYLMPGTVGSPFAVASVLTGVAFFIVGTLKSRFVGKHWLWEGFETLGIGALAAAIAYIIGLLLKPLLDGVV
ncbi:membrane protein [Oceaniferula spumae]|uniref:Membrane protein n=1 Tax=Oceaniferula spumae TaxID=2979115 RepID=A0AAT9FPW6_9BACT